MQVCFFAKIRNKIKNTPYGACFMIMVGQFLQILYDIHPPTGSVRACVGGLELRQSQRMAKAAFS